MNESLLRRPVSPIQLLHRLHVSRTGLLITARDTPDARAARRRHGHRGVALGDDGHRLVGNSPTSAPIGDGPLLQLGVLCPNLCASLAAAQAAPGTKTSIRDFSGTAAFKFAQIRHVWLNTNRRICDLVGSILIATF